MKEQKCQIGLIGLATMGANLAQNIASKKISIVVFNRTTEKTKDFIQKHGNKNLQGSKTIKEFINKLDHPRKIIIMVKAGEAVDQVIKELLPHLKKGDLIIDCGNSHFKDTRRRFEQLEKKGFHFMGCGISGGEQGALKGPSLMPGGSKKSWQMIRPVLEKIAAKDFHGKPCVTFVGERESGHYVKMVHNGIEYGVMQIMAEAYDILRTVYQLQAPEIAKIFAQYNKGKLKSYLFEIAVEILNHKNGTKAKSQYLIDFILDKAGQKGTGSWTAIESIERAAPLSTISEAVYARITSGEKDLRTKLAKIYKKPKPKKIALEKLKKLLEDSLYSSMLIIYAQGFNLIQKAAKEENWHIDLAEISRIWQGGCIIRADILNFIHKSYKKSEKYQHLFEIKEITHKLKKSIPALRKIAAFGLENGIPSAAISSSLSYFEAFTQEKSSANFIQGLRDYFGAHTYERTDKKGTFHTDWQSKEN